MPVQGYSKIGIAGKALSDLGKRQHQASIRGGLHADFNAMYGRNEKPVDLFRQMFRFSARAGGTSFDISTLVTNATWSDDSGGSAGSDGSAAYMNMQPVMTGSVQLRKPALSQYKNLLPPTLQAYMEGGADKWGALGVVIICSVGYGGNFVPLWAMRCQPTSQGSTLNGAAEEVDLSDGTWNLTLSDDLGLMGRSLDDFKFTKGKVVRKRGWRADEITVAVCRQYQLPIKQLVRGTAYFELPTSSTQGVTPLEVINAAYTEESNRTGKAFIIRWSAPDKKHPLGALEVVPFRRNPNLLRFRDQLTNAQLTRSQSPGFVTAIRGRAKLKQPHGKTKQITFDYHDERAIRRFGFIFQIVDFHPVSSMLELKILTKRAMAFRLTPLRQADLTHPGIATIRRGDAVKIDIPEEGYADLPLTVYGTPRKPRSKYTALALQQAMKNDPSIFGMPDPALLNPTSASATNVDPTTGLTADVAVMTPVADQSIAFVSSVSHTVESGSYSMDMTCGFVDLLDPTTLQAEIDANKRNAKAMVRATSSTAGHS